MGTAFADLLILVQQTIHGADRAVVTVFVEEGCEDFGGGLVGEAGFVQQVEHLLLLVFTQCPSRLWPWAGWFGWHGPVRASAHHAGAGYPERGTCRLCCSAVRRERRDGIGQGSLSFGIGGMPSKAATFF